MWSVALSVQSLDSLYVCISQISETVLWYFGLFIVKCTTWRYNFIRDIKCVYFLNPTILDLVFRQWNTFLVKINKVQFIFVSFVILKCFNPRYAFSSVLSLKRYRNISKRCMVFSKETKLCRCFQTLKIHFFFRYFTVIFLSFIFEVFEQ